MITFVLALIIILLVVAAMSVGVLFSNKPIKGTCGGMSSLGMETGCDICGGDKEKCEKETKQPVESKGKFYDASR